MPHERVCKGAEQRAMEMCSRCIRAPRPRRRATILAPLRPLYFSKLVIACHVHFLGEWLIVRTDREEGVIATWQCCRNGEWGRGGRSCDWERVRKVAS